MDNFELWLKTKVIFGAEQSKNVGKHISDFGGKKVLIHYYGDGLVEKIGLLGSVKKSLESSGISYVELGGVMPNPRVSLCRKGVEICRREKVDFILALGGGSVIDSAKAIAFGVKLDCDIWEVYKGRQKMTSALPIGVILTIAAAGSEMGWNSMLNNEETGEKLGAYSDIIRPRFVIMDPELTYTLPPFQTSCGICDTLAHVMERYFTPSQNTDFGDAMCEALMRTVIKNSPILLKEPKNYESRAEFMWEASLAHNGLLGAGRISDWTCHNLEHELSGMFPRLTHAAGITAIWPSWARFTAVRKPEKFAMLAKNVMGISPDGHSEKELAFLGIDALESFFRSVGMPIRISECKINGIPLSLTDEQIRLMAENCDLHANHAVGAYYHLSVDDIDAIYHTALAPAW